MKKLIAVVAVSICASATFAQTQSPSPATQTPATTTYKRPEKKERVDRYVRSMFGPITIGRNLASAGISTWKNSPEEWGPHWDGYGKRFASSMAKGVISNTTSFALEEAFKLDSRYVRATGKGVGYRIGNALISPLTARNKSGQRVFGFPRIAGTYASHVIAAQTWYPERYNWRDGMRSATISLGTSALFNLVKEFIHRK
jgi:hypothetical protein